MLFHYETNLCFEFIVKFNTENLKLKAFMCKMFKNPTFPIKITVNQLVTVNEAAHISLLFESI